MTGGSELGSLWDRLSYSEVFGSFFFVRGQRWDPPGVRPRQPSEASLLSCLQKNISDKCIRKITFILGVGSRRLSGERLVPWSLSDVNLSWVGKHKELFLPGFLCPVNLPFVWGKITKALPDPSRQEGFGKKLGSWMGQHFVISYLSAVLVFYCQVIWKSPGLMCLFSCHRKGSCEYLSSFPGAELRLSDTFRVTQKICDGMRNWSL